MHDEVVRNHAWSERIGITYVGLMHLSCFTTWHAFATVCVFHLQLHHIVFHHLILRWQHAVVVMTLLPVQDQVRNQGRNKIDDSMQSLLRPCCLSYFSSLCVCCCDTAALSCFAMQPFCDQAFLCFPPLPSSVFRFLPLLL